MTEEEKIKAARREYQRKYRRENAKRIQEYHKAWRDKNKDKVTAINRKHWLKKAEELGEVKS